MGTVQGAVCGLVQLGLPPWKVSFLCDFVTYGAGWLVPQCGKLKLESGVAERRGVVPVPELVGHGEGQWQASILADAAAVVQLAHSPHVGQAQGLTGLVHG